MITFDWLLKRNIDLEQKRYALQAYFKRIEHRFRDVKLFPQFDNVLELNTELNKLRSNKKALLERFPKELESLDLVNGQLHYSRTEQDMLGSSELDAIVRFSAPRFAHLTNEGNGLQQEIADRLSIEPIGILPIYRQEGYLLLHNGSQQSVQAFHYQLRLVHPKGEGRQLTTSFSGTFKTGVSSTLENIKSELIEINRELPNPATFAISAEQQLPFTETFLPVARQVLVNYVTNLAA